VVYKFDKQHLMGRLDKILLKKNCDFLALRRKIFAHGEVKIIVVHAEI
jgi:hypothetical protein